MQRVYVGSGIQSLSVLVSEELSQVLHDNDTIPITSNIT
jgi:hypothetical protein